MAKDIKVEQEILLAAKGLIQQYGVNKPTMQDVARAAGKGKSTLYYYFKNKEEIFDAVIKAEMNDFFMQVKNAVDAAEGLENKLKTYLITKVTKLEQKLKQYKVIMDNETHHFDMKHYFELNINENNLREKKLINTILKSGVESGKIQSSAIEGQDNEIITQVFLLSMRGIEVDLFINKEFKLLHEKADMMVKILTHGLS